MKNVAKRIGEVFSDIKKILAKKYLSPSRKLDLLFSYFCISIKRFLYGRPFNFTDAKKQKFLSYQIEVENYLGFYWTFKEIFIDDDYYFSSDEDDPYIIDCGGNIGVTVLYFKFLYPKARILVFEALPENAEILERNIKNNDLKNVTVIKKAVGKEKGELKMYGGGRAATLQRRFADEQNKNSDDHKRKEITVPIVPLSDHIKDDKIDLLKMDIEGAEGGVLEDLAFHNKIKNIKQLSMEYHRFSFSENKLSDIVDILEKNEFDVIFSGDYDNLSKLPKRKYYNFMIFAKIR